MVSIRLNCFQRYLALALLEGDDEPVKEARSANQWWKMMFVDDDFYGNAERVVFMRLTQLNRHSRCHCRNYTANTEIFLAIAFELQAEELGDMQRNR